MSEGEDRRRRRRAPLRHGGARAQRPPKDAPSAGDGAGGEGATARRPEAGEPGPEAVRWRGFELNDFQVRAVEAIRAGDNVLVGAPTGAGKTLVAEYAIEDAVRRGRRCIYTAPIKALSNQKYRDFRDQPEVDVGLATGDVTIHPGAQVLIMTTEILRNTIFEDPARLSDVEYVVFDEVHFLDDPERGTVWEESLIFAPPQVRFICLSATVANIGELGAWIDEIREHELVVIESKRRPVPLHHFLHAPGRGVFELEEVERVRRSLPPAAREGRRGARGGRSRRGRDGRGRDGRGRNGPGRGGRRGGFEELPRVEGLLDDLTARGLLPALVFAFSRKDCERMARANAGRELLAEGERRSMGLLQDELARLFELSARDLSAEIFSMARRGIGYHHAGMLPIHKELVERMFTSGLLKLLFTTETFALGINMPARSVVFHSLKKFDGHSVDWMRTREYLQMAGRAGRQGIDDEGLVFSVLSGRDLAEAPLARILSGRPEPVTSRFRMSYSTLLHLVADLGRERVHEAWEKSFDRFQHREETKKARERNRRWQRRTVEARLGFLEDAGYLEEGERLTPRGATARRINGYEIQVTELLYQGALENLPPQALAVVFVALVYEERRRGGGPFIPPRMFGGVRRHVASVIARLTFLEAEHGVPEPMKPPDFGLTPTVLAWCEGRAFEELSGFGEPSPGDVCRTFRMAIQLMRQARAAIEPSWDLHDGLGEAMAALNRDEVDARRQLELG